MAPSNYRFLPCLSILWLMFASACLHSQPVTTQIADIAAPSATVGSLGKYGDIPIGHHTGAASIDIPITSLSEGTISMNISLSYHGGGIRVGELASRAGLGWSVNSGGIISRAVRGLPDDAPGGYYHNGSNLVNDFSKQIAKDQVKQVLSGSLDSEPDVFSFNFSGYTGKFYLTGNSSDPIVLLPHTDVIFEVVSSGGRIIGFEAITPDGTQYFFGTGSNLPGQTLVGETTDIFPKSQFSEVDVSKFLSSWYLVRITSADDLYTINFSYEEEEYTYVTPTGAATNYVRFDVPRCGSTGGRTLPHHTGATTSSVNNIVIEGYRLREIQTSTKVVEFVGSTTRLDVVSPDPSKAAYRLDQIVVKEGLIPGGNPDYYRCKQFELDYGYFKGYAYSDRASSSKFDPDQAYRLRLRLKTVTEQTCSAVNRQSKPPYRFVYNGSGRSVDGHPYFPHRLSQAIDHWGYFNGHDSNNQLTLNAPPTPVEGFNNVGEANRTTDPSSMQLGTLKEYFLPTGGRVLFKTEANQVDDIISVDVEDVNLIDLTNCTWEYDQTTPNQPNSCCSPSTRSDIMVFETEEEILFGTYKILLPYVYLDELEVEDPDNICSYRNNVQPVGTVRIKTGDTILGSVTLDLGSTNPDEYGPNIKTGSIHYLFDKGFSPQVGVEYIVELIANGGTAELRIDTKREVPSKVQYVGGLRIQSLQMYSAENKLLTRTDYAYVTDDLETSGRLFDRPRYGYSYSSTGNPRDDANFTGYEVRSTPVFPLANYIGNHCWYTRVEESRPGAGKSIYTFANQSTSADQGSFPTADTPVPPDFMVGKLLSQSEYNIQQKMKISERKNDGSEVKDIKNKSDGTPLVAYALKTMRIGLPGSTFECLASGSSSTLAIPLSYYLYEGYYQLDGYSQTTDGVLTEVDYAYDSPKGHQYITSEKTKLGDGRTVSTTYTYPEDHSGAVYADMEDRNMLLPISTVKRVINGNTVFEIDGMRTNYAFLSGSFPRPASVDRLERTPAIGGDWTGGWETQGTINAYQDGFPSSVTSTGWSPTTYIWSTSGLLLTKTYLDFTESYDYYPGTRLLRESTATDGQQVLYEYDGLSRLQKIIAREEELITQFSYVYRGQDPQHPGNYVRTTTEFDVSPSPMFNASDRVAYTYVDDLGRPLQTVRQQANNPGDGSTFYDVVSDHRTYDMAGRPQRSYRPFHSPGTDGQFSPPPSDSNAYTETIYYPDPLARPHEVTPPEWDPTTYVYKSNANTLADPAGTVYPPGTLQMLSVTDADDLETITYSDRLGLVVLTEQYGSNGTLKSQTWHAYDAKQRLTGIYPPGTDGSDTKLIYRYTYDGKDQILTKKIPDRPLEHYFYNSRNLLTYLDNASLPEAFNFLATAYDDYGRPLGSGFTTSRANGNEASMTDFTEGDNLLTRTTYGPSVDSFLRNKVVKKESWVMNGKVPDTVAIRKDFTYDPYGRVDTTKGNHISALSNYRADLTQSVWSPDDQIVQEWHEITAMNNIFSTKNISYLDRAGQVYRRTHELGQNNTTASVELARYKYSAAGELLRESLNSDLQVVDYTYLPNGMLESINNPSVPGNDLFAVEINYYDGANSSGGTSNGNITGLTHFGIGMGLLTQTFAYDDGLNRLTNAVTLHNDRSYSSSYSYDQRGNLTGLSRSGKRTDGSFGPIDELIYYSISGSNRIGRITDNGEPEYQAGFDNQASNVAYGYDAVGNITTDPNNDLQIDYNHLNLPYRFIKGDGTVVEIIYTATGQKLREMTTPSAGPVRMRTYHGDMEFVDDQFAFASHAHGRVVATGQCQQLVTLNGQHDTDNTIVALEIESMATVSSGVSVTYRAEKKITLQPSFTVEAGATFEAQISPCDDGNAVGLRYEYFLRDHLGNNVIHFADVNEDGVVSESEILQENHYYAFGLEMEGAWQELRHETKQRYKFNGIERNEELGLDLAFYRSYDPTIGRWLQVDPKAEAFTWTSPYSGMLNNPISNIDPLGDTTRVYNMQGVLVRTINDSHKNQEHFLTDRNLEILGGANHSDLDVDGIGTAFRNGSSFFVGANTRDQLQAIVELAESEGLERAYTLSFSSSQKELQVNDVTGNSSRTSNNLTLRNNLSSGNGRDVIVGHVHPTAGAKNVNVSPSNVVGMNTPSSGYNRLADYESLLTGDRSRAYPQMISTVHGYNVYTSARNTPAGSSHSAPYQVLSKRGTIINYSGVKIVD